MQTHPVIGAQIIGRHDDDLLATAYLIALTHHEKWDGSGYPAGLAGEEISLVGRIVAVADVLDALLLTRPYKPAFSLEKSLAYIDSQSGRQFDPKLVAALHVVLPEIINVNETFADERGALTDLLADVPGPC